MEEPSSVDESKGRTFSPSEREALREWLEIWERIKWLARTVRILALWISAAVAAVYAVLNVLRDGVKAAIKGGGGG